MEFRLHVNKWAVFYFFVQNLSGWHFSNRKNYNILWRKELGWFSIEEEEALKQFKEIHIKYPFGKFYLGRQFFIGQDPWIALEKTISREDCDSLKNIFSLLDGKLQKLYKKESSLLISWQKIIHSKLSDKNSTKQINTTLSKLFNADPITKDIDIYLLPSSENMTGGSGGTVNNRSINLEISRYQQNSVNHAIGIIWHEVIHLYYERKYLLPLLSKMYSNDDSVKLVRETINSSLFPNGVLGIKFFKNKSVTLNNKIPSEYTTKLLELTSLFVNKEKAFDEKYIKKLFSLVSKLKGTVK